MKQEVNHRIERIKNYLQDIKELIEEVEISEKELFVIDGMLQAVGTNTSAIDEYLTDKKYGG